MTIRNDMVVDHSRHDSDTTLSSEVRFKRRLDGDIAAAVAKLIKERKVTDLTSGGKVVVSGGPTVQVRLREPTFHYDERTGNPEFVLVGNPHFRRGDIIEKPECSAGQDGSGSGAGLGEDSEDDFVFELNEGDLAKHLMEGLGLPNLKLKKFHLVTTTALQRTGLQTDGPAAMLDMGITVRRAIGRRKALLRPGRNDVQLLEDQIQELEEMSERDDTHSAALVELKLELERLQAKRRSVPYFDPSDLRYRRNTPVTRPVTKAVMFALMDRSGSMGQHHKDLAKQFFWLLQLMLRQRYDTVEVVWIAHTDTPKEVDEQEFFFGTKTGGTVVSTALELMMKIRAERYLLDEYNVFCCQAGDGDTWRNYRGEDDAVVSASLVETSILPEFQYFAYIECHGSGIISSSPKKNRKKRIYDSPLWEAYGGINKPSHFAMKRVSDPEQIYPVFRNLFSVQDNEQVSVK